VDGDLREADDSATPADDDVDQVLAGGPPAGAPDLRVIAPSVPTQDPSPATAPASAAAPDGAVFERIVHEHGLESAATATAPAQGDEPAVAPPPPTDEELLDRAVEQLAAEDGVDAHVEDRLIRIDNPVAGNPHLAALQALGFAAKVKPVGAAAHGPLGVAAAVWQQPNLYIARWTGQSRWVAAYKFPMRARPDEYLREESGIPSHLGKGNWYADVPDEITEAFFAVGLLLDEPPYEVPKVAAKPPPPEPAPRAARSSSPREPRAPRSSSTTAARPPAAPKAPRKRAAPAPKKVVVTTRTCTMCNLQKHVSQFVEGSDWCVDCR
jgi:hypothetical protein